MREILFRGKSLDNGEWEYGYYCKKISDMDYVDCIQEMCDRGCIRHKVDPNTLGQFTGLLDKNGITIFEGDVVETMDGDGVVRWYYREFYSWVICFDDFTMPLSKAHDVLITGNIHEEERNSGEIKIMGTNNMYLRMSLLKLIRNIQNLD